MKFYAYPDGKPLNEHGLVELSELTFRGDADALRTIAQFLLASADEMDKLGQHFGHSHLQDACETWDENWPDVIVAG